ncbi:MAG: trypsin-like peptidase domain-containing protein [Candidatus Poribacteria bacterium]|nr:trypsin-like peptidase domain-containing protein [Candidatus Poribacteria bacterium]
MKQISFFVLVLLLVAILFSIEGFAQDYVHYKTLTGHTYHVYSVSFSPDGRMLASGSADNTIRLWESQSGMPIKILTGHTWTVWSVGFSPDGRTLVSASHDQTVRLWDLQSGIQKKILKGHTDVVYSVGFSPDSRTLASASGGPWPTADNTIWLWDAATGVFKKSLNGHVKSIESVSFSPDGKTLASGGWDDTVRLWNVSTGKLLKTLKGHSAEVTSVSFIPDGLILASGGGFGDNTVRFWDVATGKHKTTLEGHTGSVQSIVFSPDGKTLASGSGDFTVRLWDVQTSKQKITLTGHTSDVRTVAFSPDGKTLASGSMDNTIRLWRVSSEQSINTGAINLSKYLDLPKPPKPTANQIYTNAIRAVMWIVNPGISEGSGVLLDKKSKLAVTNAHVTGKQNTIDVYFPASDEKGELIKDRNFYLTNGGVLKRLGYYTKGHVIARNEKTDLAIIRLDGLPETAREIDWKLTPPATKAGELVYILGNPVKQELWRWTLGEFLNNHGDFLHIQSDVFGGNSGGPVLNKQGILLGIVARSDQLMNAAAIPARHISKLLSESKVKHSRIRR